MKAPEVSRTHSHHSLIVVGDQSQAFIKFTRTKFRSRVLFYQGWSAIWAATNYSHSNSALKYYLCFSLNAVVYEFTRILHQNIHLKSQRFLFFKNQG